MIHVSGVLQCAVKPSKHEILTQCLINDGATSKTVGNHWVNVLYLLGIRHRQLHPTTGICIVIYNASVLVSQCLQQSTVHTIEIERCETVPHPFMALKRDLLLDFRHRPNTIFSIISYQGLYCTRYRHFLPG